MGRLESALREEIARLARKATRQQQAKTVKDVQKLKRRMSQLQSEVKGLKRALASEASRRRAVAASGAAAEAGLEKTRLSPWLIQKLRKRHGITQGDLATLLGVSLSAVGFWEYGKTKPKASMKARIIGLRSLGRRDVKRLLAEKKAAAKAAAPKKKAPKKKATRRRKRGK